jgi:two-component system alkaline phosphatase synthesis response regulator PhoP
MAAGRVIVIDDDPDFLDYVVIVLSSNGYEVQTATNAAAGIDLIRAWMPQLVIADVMLSYSLEGCNISRAMRADPQLQGIPLMLVSAIVSDDDDAVYPSIRDAQVDGFMRKPLEPADLVARVAELLQSR